MIGIAVTGRQVLLDYALQHYKDGETIGLELDGLAVQGGIHRLHSAGLVVKVQNRDFFFCVHRRADQQDRHLDVLSGLIADARRRIHQADVESSGKAEILR